ncbi:MAG: DegT/DnrJ/EryC1/StrS family aminotransferase, partial [Opitutales bacterium]
NLRDCPAVILPQEMPWCGRHAYHLFVVRFPEHDRDAVAQKLSADGIQTVVHYPIPIHLQKAYAALGHRAGAFPQAEEAARSILSLPMFPELTRDQCDHVCERLRAALR